MHILSYELAVYEKGYKNDKNLNVVARKIIC